VPGSPRYRRASEGSAGDHGSAASAGRRRKTAAPRAALAIIFGACLAEAGAQGRTEPSRRWHRDPAEGCRNRPGCHPTKRDRSSRKIGSDTTRNSGSQKTRCWRKPDSNRRSLSENSCVLPAPWELGRARKLVCRHSFTAGPEVRIRLPPAASQANSGVVMTRPTMAGLARRIAGTFQRAWV
jgi:hypothetical protein